MYKHFLKRFFDIMLSFFGLLVLAIPFLIIAIVIKIDSPGPVFFKQQRYGRKKKMFSIIKFRSMPESAPHETPTCELRNTDSLFTKWQRFMRRTSIDELPQLFCILVGHMSIIGPRPVLKAETELIDERDKYGANDVRPGLTGWAQVNGRDEIDFPEKARLDGEYVAKLNAGWFRGFAMDFKCFFRTVTYVFKSEGVVEGGTGEMRRQEQQNQHEQAQEVLQ